MCCCMVLWVNNTHNTIQQHICGYSKQHPQHHTTTHFVNVVVVCHLWTIVPFDHRTYANTKYLQHDIPFYTSNMCCWRFTDIHNTKYLQHDIPFYTSFIHSTCVVGGLPTYTTQNTSNTTYHWCVVYVVIFRTSYVASVSRTFRRPFARIATQTLIRKSWVWALSCVCDVVLWCIQCLVYIAEW